VNRLLWPKGCLFLGASETIGPFTDLFEQMDKKHKIYFKIPGPSPALNLQRTTKHVEAGKQFAVSKPLEAPGRFCVEPNAQREADRLTRNRYAPPSVLVNAEWHVLEFRGHTSPYLEPPTGQANFSVLKVAREEMMLPLRAALNKAKKEKQSYSQGERSGESKW
jgi:two-component system CheB/CheR fusion protein